MAKPKYTLEQLLTARDRAKTADNAEAVQILDQELLEQYDHAVVDTAAATPKSAKVDPSTVQQQNYVGAVDAQGAPFFGARDVVPNSPMTTAPRERPFGEGLIRSFGEGLSGGWMGEIQGAIGDVQSKINPEAFPPGTGDQYRRVTDMRRQAFEAENPWSGRLADLAGTVTGAALLPGGGVPQAAALGGVHGAGRAGEGNREVGTILGAATGGLGGWLVPKVLGGVSDALLKKIPPTWVDGVTKAFTRKPGTTVAAYNRGVELGEAQIAARLAKDALPPAAGNVIATNPATRELPARLLPSEKVLADEIKAMGAVDRHALRMGLLKTIGDQLDEGIYSGATPEAQVAREALMTELTPVMRAAFKGSRKGGDVVAAFEHKIKSFAREPQRTSIQLGRMGGQVGGRVQVPTPSDVRWPRIPLGETAWARGVLAPSAGIAREAGSPITNMLQQGAGAMMPMPGGILGGGLAPPLTEQARGLLGQVQGR